MTHEQITDKLIEWADVVLPELQGTYDHPPEERTQPFPDIACEIVDVRYSESPGAMTPAIQQIEQIRTQEADCELLLAVSPDPPATASSTLRDFTQRLANAALADDTLGGRVSRIGRDFSFSFRPPFAQFDDGSQARVATMRITVVDLV